MSDPITDPQETLIDGFTRAQWTFALKTLTADPGWNVIERLLSPLVNEAESTLFNSPEPERQLALHEAIGFLKFPNKLVEIRNRARFISERGLSPEAAIRETPL